MVASENSVAADNSSPEDELKRRKRKISLANCNLCGSNEARYRCPGCFKQTCSLSCVRKHKEDSGCRGVRDKTAFVALSQFDELNLLNDYRFLEDTGRMAGSSNRDKLASVPAVTQRIKTLSAQARKLSMTLKFLPITFTKSKENSTIFLKKEKRFYWRLKLLFPQSECEFVERRVSDEQTLEQILTCYIHPAESEPVRRQKLKMYVRSPFDHVRVFMKAEGRQANSVRYQELDMTKSLRENLKFKTVIEYPVFHVVLEDHCHNYPLKGPAWRVSPGSGRREGTADPSRPRPGLGGPGAAPEASPDAGPPQEKKPKREPVDEELEEGEIRDSDDGGGGEDDEDDGGVKDANDNVASEACGVDAVGGSEEGGDGNMTSKEGGDEPHSLNEPAGENDSHVVKTCEEQTQSI
ncbi:box C/D snoRNA protein 1 [Osmerus eperlanus]|uniref:box C/D snoRNA protein 1 n=1 Tax=Osmerus eperlanus TaxID=29151 RepID=UPI002E0EF06B